MWNVILIGALFGIAISVNAQQPKTSGATRVPVSMDRYPGGSVVTELSSSIKLNKESTLNREWFVVRDDNVPLNIEGPAGINVVYESGGQYSSGRYLYKVAYSLRAKEPIAAFELRVVVLDVFGKLIKTLTATQLTDFSDAKSFNGTWTIWSENEASEAFASVTYVAQVRTAGGRVYEADRAAVVEQVRKVGKRITVVDLEPKRETPVPPK